MRLHNALLCLLVATADAQSYGDPHVITVGVGVCPSYSSMLASYSTILPTYSSMTAAPRAPSSQASLAESSFVLEVMGSPIGSQQQQPPTTPVLLPSVGQTSSTASPVPASSSSSTAITCGQNYTDSSGSAYAIQCDTGLSGTTIQPPPGYMQRRQDERMVPDTNGLQDCLNSCDNTASCQAVTYLGASCILYSAVTGAMEVIGGQTAYNQERFVGFVSPENCTVTSSISDGLVPTVSMSASTISASYVSPASILTGYITEGTSTGPTNVALPSSSSSSASPTLVWAYPTPIVSSSPLLSSTDVGTPPTSVLSTTTNGMLSSLGITPLTSSIFSGASTTITTPSLSSLLSPSSLPPVVSSALSSSLPTSLAVSLPTSTTSSSQMSSTSSSTYSSSSAGQTSSATSVVPSTSTVLSTSSSATTPFSSSSSTSLSSSFSPSPSSSSAVSSTVQPVTQASSTISPSSSSPLSRSSSLSVYTTSSSSTVNSAPSSYPVRNTGKRGLCYTNDSYTLPYALSGQNSKVSWSYNWYISKYSGNDTIFNPAIQFIPLLYNDNPGLTSVWPAAVENAISQGADALMSFNEPDACAPGSACMTVNQSVAGFRAYMQPYAGRVKLGAPAITNGGPPSSLTYLGWFMGNCTGCTIDFINLHWYSNVYAFSYLQYYVELAYSQFGLPIWVTEFGIDGSGGTEAQYEAFLEQALPWLDVVPYVERYAYFFDGPGYLINANGTALSAQGEIYNSYTANCTNWNNTQGHC